MEYAWPYLIYFIVLLFVHMFYCTKLKNHGYSEEYAKSLSKYCDILVGASFLFFFGLRGFIYTDCFQYYSFFQNNTEYELSYLSGWYEPGYILCNQIISLFTDSFWVFQFIWTAVDFLLLRAILKRECGHRFYLAFAFLLPFWTGAEMNLFRNAKAILIAFWAMQFLRDRQLIKYVLSLALASTFHVTALFFLPLYFFIHRPMIKVYIACAVVAMSFYITGLDSVLHNFIGFGKMIGGRMDVKAVAYATDVKANLFSFGFLYRAFLAILFLCVYRVYYKKNVVFANLSLIYCFIFIGLSSITVLRDRFSVMFVLALAVSLVQVFKCVDNILIRRICAIINMIFLSMFLFVQVNNPAAQYENHLFGISTYSQAYSRIFAVVGK